MPTTLAGALVILLVALPGLPGDKIYRLLIGSSWRETPWQSTLRLFGFSLFGLALYTVAGSLISAPHPSYLVPATLLENLAGGRTTVTLFTAYLGHFVGSGVGGMIVGLGLRGLRNTRRLSPFYSTWDHFLQICAPYHWLLVTLKNGEVYCGKLELAEPSVGLGERDIILEEPAVYDNSKENYIALAHNHLFIPGDCIESLATVHDPALDQRECPIGEAIFKRSVINEPLEVDNP